MSADYHQAFISDGGEPPQRANIIQNILTRHFFHKVYDRDKPGHEVSSSFDFPSELQKRFLSFEMV